MKNVLQKMLEQLRLLQDSLAQEEAALSARTVIPAALHRITENKNEQLTSLSYLDGQRQALDQQQRLTAPYNGQPELQALWHEIQTLTRSLNRNNQRNGLLLNQHMKYTNEALAFLQSKRSHDLYGPDGQAAAPRASAYASKIGE